MRTSEIVKRLRSYEIGNLAMQAQWIGDMREAADEIERLQRLLAGVDHEVAK